MGPKIKELSSLVAKFSKYVHEEIILQILRNEEYTSEPQRFFYSILFKTNNGLDTSNYLIANFISKPHFLDSLFIIFRSLLSDTITFNYVIYKSLEKDNLEENIKALYFDHIDHTLKNYDGVYRVIHQMSDQQVADEKAKLKKTSGEYFDVNGQPRFQPLPSLPGKAMRYIFSNHFDKKKLAPLKRAFDLYDMFSKYEHFGELSFDMIHRQFKEKNQERLYTEIIDTIDILTLTMESTLNAWPSLQKETKLEFEKHSKVISNFE